MSKEKPTTKLCKHCKMEIPYDAKICPHCRKKQGGKAKWIIGAVIVLALIGALFGGDSENEDIDEGGSADTVAETMTETIIEYTSYTVDEMMEDLNNNPMSASQKYKDQYIEITGKLNVIDSDGKYISLYPDDAFAIVGVQCYIQNDEQRDQIMQMSIDDQVTLRGKCISVGEVLGYSLDIDSIN